MNKGMINRRFPGNKGYDSRYILSKVIVFLAAFFLCVLFAVVKPVEVKADTHSGTVYTHELSDNEEVNINGNANIIIDSNKTIKTMSSNVPNITVTITGDTGNTLTCEGLSIGNNETGYGTLIINSANLKVTKTGISAKNIEINGGTIETKSEDSYAIYGVGVVVINGGNVIAEGGDSGIFLDSNKQITISNNAKVTATGNNFGIISSTGNINIDNATVTATGKAGDYASGISTNGNVTITDATVTATGVPHAIYTAGGPGDNKISISGASTVVKASCEYGAAIEVAQGTQGKMTISEPLEVTSPVGGGLSADGKYIATKAGGTDGATDVEIWGIFKVTTKAENGTATAKPETVKKGTKIELSATPAEGYVFTEWTSEDGVIFADAKSAATTFDMPAKDVTVKANFKEDISKASVSKIKDRTYTGKKITPSPTVKLGGKTLKKGTDYKVSYKNNKNAGTATVTITGKGNYSGTVKKTFKIKKADNKLNVKAKNKTYSRSYSKKKKKEISGKDIYKFTKKNKTKGTIKYTLSSVKKGKKKVTKGFSVSKSNGKLTIKAGVAKGSYKITVKVTAGDKNYKTVKNDVKFTVEVK